MPTSPRDMISEYEWESTRFVLRRLQELSRSANGSTQAKDLGSPIWATAEEFRTKALPRQVADSAIANFQSLRGPIFPFYAYDVSRTVPISIEGQTIPDLGSVTVESINANRSAIALTGLPVGFVMSNGDYISVTTSIGGIEFFRINRAWGGTANSGGSTGEMEVEPNIRPSVMAGDIVDLVNPKVEMQLVPNSLNDPYSSTTHRRIVFQATQVIR